MRQPILLVGVEGEAEMMLAQHIAHENQTYALSVGLCGEERREEFLLHFGTYAVAVVDDFEGAPMQADGYCAVLPDALRRVFHDVGEHLLKQGLVDWCSDVFIAETENKAYVARRA